MENQIDFLENVLYAVQEKGVKGEESRMIEAAIAGLQNSSQPPEDPISISFRYEDISYKVFYSEDKLEFSDYASVDCGYGIDHEQSFLFLYSRDEQIEEGDFYNFEEVFMRALENVSVNEIYVGEEEC